MENELNRAAIDALVAQMNIEEGNSAPDIDKALTKAVNMLIERLQERESQIEFLRKLIGIMDEQIKVKDEQINRLVDLLPKR